MRRPLIITAAAGLMLTLLTAVAPSASAATEVNVYDFAYTSAGLDEKVYACGGWESAAVANRYYEAGYRGQASNGWDPQPGTEAGVFVDVPNPATVNEVSAKLWSTSSGSGEIIVFYCQTGYDGYWVGRASLTNPVPGEWRVASALAPTLSWRYYFPGGSASTTTDSGTLTSFTASRGGNGRGARVGFLQGCNNERFYLDDLHVGSTIYDLEGPLTHSHIESWDGRRVLDGNRTITAGQQLDLLGHAHWLWNGGWQYITGTGTLYALPYGSRTWRAVAKGTFREADYASIRTAPTRRTAYRYGFASTGVFLGSTSETMWVNVVARLSAKVRDHTLKQGQRLQVTGAVAPATRGMKVSLQRKSGKRWKTIATARTNSRGAYKLSVKTKSSGRWTVRVVLSSGSGLIGRASGGLGTVKIARKKAPRPVVTDRAAHVDYVVAKPAPIRRPAPPPRRSAD